MNTQVTALTIGLTALMGLNHAFAIEPLNLNIQCVDNTQAKVHTLGNNMQPSLKYIGTSIASAPFDTSAAEIVSYDSCSDKLYVVNAQAKLVDILSLNPQGVPSPFSKISLSAAAKAAGIAIGAANSVATHNGLIAIAIENANKQDNGIIALYRADDLSLLATYSTGALPDMVGFSKDGRFIASANEGEPSSDYSVDPNGSITLIDLANGIENAKVSQIGFENLTSIDNNVRVSGKNATLAQDLEPEYLTFADNGKIYVALQENNALAIINPYEQHVESIVSLGEKSWATSKLDASNKDKKLANLQSYPQLVGLYMPDTIDSYTVGGKTYIVTANEGDGREYGFDTTQQQCDQLDFSWDEDDYSNSDDYTTKSGFCISHSDEVRGKKLNVAKDHPLYAALKDKKQLARLKVVNPNRTLAADENVQAFGARSFSIWDENGRLVFDSGDQFAKVVAQNNQTHFNSTNDSNASGDDRSDDKGVEPEAIEIITLGERYFALIGLERQGGIMVYEVTSPEKPRFIEYINRRNFTENVCTSTDDGECDNDTYNPLAGDLGPESINYFTRHGQHFIAVGNEVSGTTSVYRLDW